MSLATPGEPVPCAIELASVSKRYPNGVLANDAVSLTVRRGEIHAIVGENGAGKSTVLKMLYGLESPTEGEIRIEGRAMSFTQPRQAIAAGIGLVPQHMQLLASMSVADNVVLGSEPMRGMLLDLRGAEVEVARVADRFGLPVDPRAIVGRLSVGEQQRVEILKALYRGARILLLDEPTAVLPPAEAQAMFTALRALTAAGLTVVLITHKLSEVLEAADSFTVMRAGRVVGRRDARHVDVAQLGALIAGQPVAASAVQRATVRGAQPLVRARGLSVRSRDGRDLLAGVSFDIASGEILGIAGVEGNGQAQLAEVLCCLRRPGAGEASLAGEPFSGGTVRDARALGVAIVPEDRMHTGVALDMSISDNYAATAYHQAPLSHLGWLDEGAAHARACAALSEYGVVAPSADAPIRVLSGGNMQKVVLAREVASRPRFLIACQPTRGVDIVAAQFLRRRLVDLRDAGAAILLVSADLDELLELSDRIVVLHGGRCVAHLPADTPAHELGAYMTGLKQQPDASGELPNTAVAAEEAMA
jgi:simple sugar transport system ATP-binding protein